MNENTNTQTSAQILKERAERALAKTAESWATIPEGAENVIFFKMFKKTKAEALEALSEEGRAVAERSNKDNTRLFNSFRSLGGVRDEKAEAKHLAQRNFRVTIYSHGDWELLKFRNGTLQLTNKKLRDLYNTNEEESIIEDMDDAFEF